MSDGREAKPQIAIRALPGLLLKGTGRLMMTAGASVFFFADKFLYEIRHWGLLISLGASVLAAFALFSVGVLLTSVADR